MALIDFSPLTDTDLSEMVDREIPCEVRRLGDGKPLPGCTDAAAFWLKLTCRRCGFGERVPACPPCAKFLGWWARILCATIVPWLKDMKHDSCRRPVLLRVTSGPL